MICFLCRCISLKNRADLASCGASVEHTMRLGIVYIVILLQSAFLLCTPLSHKNWYNITVNIISQFIGFLTRILYRKYHTTRTNQTAFNYVLVFYSYTGDLTCMVVLSLHVANYFPAESIRSVVYHPQFCNVYSVLEFTILFAFAICTNLLALVRLAINLAPYWFASINHDAIKVPIYVCISGLSLLIPVTGYRLKTLLYCDQASFHIKLIFLGFEQRFYKQVFSTNYPEILIFALLSVILHFVSVCIEWHKEMIKTKVSAMHLEQTEGRSNIIENQSIPRINLSEVDSNSQETFTLNPSSAPVLQNHNLGLPGGSEMNASHSGNNFQYRPPIIPKETNLHGPRLDANGLGKIMGVYDYDPSSEQVYVVDGKNNLFDLEAKPNIGSEESKPTECILKNILKSSAKGCCLIVLLVVYLLSIVALLMTEDDTMFAIANFVYFSLIKLECVVVWSWLLLSNDDMKAFTIRHLKIWITDLPDIYQTRLTDLLSAWLEGLENQMPQAAI